MSGPNTDPHSSDIYSSVRPGDYPSQGPLLNGYRKLSDEEVKRANEIKTMGSYIELLVDKLRADPNADQRWVAEGRTDLQKGLMSLTRAVTKPTSF